MMGNTLVKAAVTDFLLQWGLFLIAAYMRTERFFDLAGSSTFVLLAVQSLINTGRFFPRQVIQSGLVSTWAVRLGLFLFFRVLKEGHDSRFNRVRDNPTRFFIYWTVQGEFCSILELQTNLSTSLSGNVKLTLIIFSVQVFGCFSRSSPPWSWTLRKKTKSSAHGTTLAGRSGSEECFLKWWLTTRSTPSEAILLTVTSGSVMVCGVWSVTQITWGRSCSGLDCSSQHLPLLRVESTSVWFLLSLLPSCWQRSPEFLCWNDKIWRGGKITLSSSVMSRGHQKWFRFCGEDRATLLIGVLAMTHM